jgi:hypothetical protein
MGIENRLRSRLDAVFREDVSTTRNGSATAVLASVRRLALNLFEQEGCPIGLAKKQRQVAWDDELCAEVVFGS